MISHILLVDGHVSIPESPITSLMESSSKESLCNQLVEVTLWSLLQAFGSLFLYNYSPFIFQTMATILTILQNIFFPYSKDSDSRDRVSSSRRQKEALLSEKETIDMQEKVKKYTHFTDDREANKGSEDDIYMLKTYKYNKFRFLSQGFIERNQLHHQSLKSVKKKSM